MIRTYNAERDGLHTTVVRCLGDYKRPLPPDFPAHCIGRAEAEVAAAVARLIVEGAVAVTPHGAVLAPEAG
jgi:hypothetical protein